MTISDMMAKTEKLKLAQSMVRPIRCGGKDYESVGRKKVIIAPPGEK